MGLPFTDGDHLHPDSNVMKMNLGVPLDDHDREPWLLAVGAVLKELGGIVACSVLKQTYRESIRKVAPGVQFFLLSAPEETLDARLALRTGHFMPQSLLPSQLAALELPIDESDIDVIEATASVDQIVQKIHAILRLI